MGGVRECVLILLMKHGGIAGIENRWNVWFVCWQAVIENIGRALV